MTGGVAELQALPAAGWAAVFCLLALAAAVLFGCYRILLKKEVRLKNMEIFSRKELKEDKEEIKVLAAESARHEASDLISSQYSTSLNLLQKLRLDIYEAGTRRLGLSDKKDQLILLDIAWIVEARIAREVLLDLVRNHIAGKDGTALAEYSKAKADGYWRRIKTDLFSFAPQLPGVDLPSLMDHVRQEDFRELFEEVYSSALRIAGQAGGQ